MCPDESGCKTANTVPASNLGGKKQCELQTNNMIVWATKVGQKHLTLYKLPSALGSLLLFQYAGLIALPVDDILYQCCGRAQAPSLLFFFQSQIILWAPLSASVFVKCPGHRPWC